MKIKGKPSPVYEQHCTEVHQQIDAAVDEMQRLKGRIWDLQQEILAMRKHLKVLAELGDTKVGE